MIFSGIKYLETRLEFFTRTSKNVEIFEMDIKSFNDNSDCKQKINNGILHFVSNKILNKNEILELMK